MIEIATFVGVDLGWYGKPSGLASIEYDGAGLRFRDSLRLTAHDDILDWIGRETGSGTAVVAVDAPLVIPNDSGIRLGERELNREFQRFHAGCHPANLGRPFAQHVTEFSRKLEEMGFIHGPSMQARQPGRFQIEVHPHAAAVKLFGLDRIVKYKRGRRAERAAELNRLRTLLADRLAESDPRVALTLPPVPATGNTKDAEDRIDAVLCAYIAAYWWHWGTERNSVFGNACEGYIVVPNPGGILRR